MANRGTVPTTRKSQNVPVLKKNSQSDQVFQNINRPFLYVRNAVVEVWFNLNY